MTEWVDNSILETVAKCSLQALVRYAYGYTTLIGKAMANIGKAVHEGHASYFTDWDAARALAAVMAAYDRLVSGQEQAAFEPKDGLDRVNVEAIVRQYYTTHPAEYFPFEPVAQGIEQVHSAPLCEGVQFFGLVDLPVREKATGVMYVCDHKNRFGYINEWWTKKFGLTSQFTGYVWVLQQMTGETVPGVYINAIAVQKLPDAVKTKCRVHKVPYNKCRLQHAKAELFITTRSPLMIERWYGLAVGLARKWLQLKKAFNTVEMAAEYAPAEGQFNGACTFCDFRKWCRADRAIGMLSSEAFVVEHWRPWERGG